MENLNLAVIEVNVNGCFNKIIATNENTMDFLNLVDLPYYATENTMLLSSDLSIDSLIDWSKGLCDSGSTVEFRVIDIQKTGIKTLHTINKKEQISDNPIFNGLFN